MRHLTILLLVVAILGVSVGIGQLAEGQPQPADPNADAQKIAELEKRLAALEDLGIKTHIKEVGERITFLHEETAKRITALHDETAERITGLHDETAKRITAVAQGLQGAGDANKDALDKVKLRLDAIENELKQMGNNNAQLTAQVQVLVKVVAELKVQIQIQAEFSARLASLEKK